MKISAYLAVNGTIKIANEEDDDSPLVNITFSNEATQLSDAGRLRLASVVKMALAHELAHCVVIHMPTVV